MEAFDTRLYTRFTGGSWLSFFMCKCLKGACMDDLGVMFGGIFNHCSWLGVRILVQMPTL